MSSFFTPMGAYSTWQPYYLPKGTYTAVKPKKKGCRKLPGRAAWVDGMEIA